jgi:hypothetical protein
MFQELHTNPFLVIAMRHTGFAAAFLLHRTTREGNIRGSVVESKTITSLTYQALVSVALVADVALIPSPLPE